MMSHHSGRHQKPLEVFKVCPFSLEYLLYGEISYHVKKKPLQCTDSMCAPINRFSSTDSINPLHFVCLVMIKFPEKSKLGKKVHFGLQLRVKEGMAKRAWSQLSIMDQQSRRGRQDGAGERQSPPQVIHVLHKAPPPHGFITFPDNATSRRPCVQTWEHTLYVQTTTNLQPQ